MIKYTIEETVTEYPRQPPPAETPVDTTKYPERGCNCVYCRYARARGYSEKEPAGAASPGTDWGAWQPYAIIGGVGAFACAVLLRCLSG